MDRTNNSNAISDNLPEDLGFDIDVVNTATAIYSVLFSVACLSGAVVAKVAGPSRCWWSFFLFSFFFSYLLLSKALYRSAVATQTLIPSLTVPQLVGSTTENPSFKLTSALLSRCR